MRLHCHSLLQAGFICTLRSWLLSQLPGMWWVGGKGEMSLIMKEWVSQVPVMMSGFDSWDHCGLTEMMFGDERLRSRFLGTWLDYKFTAELRTVVLNRAFIPLCQEGAEVMLCSKYLQHYDFSPLVALDFSISFKGRYGHVTFYGPNQSLLLLAGRRKWCLLYCMETEDLFVISAYLTNTQINGHKIQEGRSLAFSLSYSWGLVQCLAHMGIWSTIIERDMGGTGQGNLKWSDLSLNLTLTQLCKLERLV